jgi:hypothetical protein
VYTQYHCVYYCDTSQLHEVCGIVGLRKAVQHVAHQQAAVPGGDVIETEDTEDTEDETIEIVPNTSNTSNVPISHTHRPISMPCNTRYEPYRTTWSTSRHCPLRRGRLRI